jgi:hypothetical protein
LDPKHLLAAALQTELCRASFWSMDCQRHFIRLTATTTTTTTADSQYWYSSL